MHRYLSYYSMCVASIFSDYSHLRISKLYCTYCRSRPTTGFEKTTKPRAGSSVSPRFFVSVQCTRRFGEMDLEIWAYVFYEPPANPFLKGCFIILFSYFRQGRFLLLLYFCGMFVSKGDPKIAAKTKKKKTSLTAGQGLVEHVCANEQDLSPKSGVDIWSLCGKCV